MKMKITQIFCLAMALFSLIYSCQLEPITSTEQEIEDSSQCLNPDVEAQISTKAGTPYMKLYIDINYRGKYYILKESIGDFSKIGFDDRISSIRVYNGAQANFYVDARGCGDYMFVFEHISNLKTYSYNDKFSSAFFRSTRTYHFAVMYEHDTYRGKSVMIDMDYPTIRNMSDLRTNLNDKVSSIRVFNIKLRVYEHRNFGGRPRDYTSNISNLKYHNFGDIISSAKIIY